MQGKEVGQISIFLQNLEKPLSSRYPGYMGFVKIGNDSVFLQLMTGNNELIFAVTNQRFGWGFAAQLVDF